MSTNAATKPKFEATPVQPTNAAPIEYVIDLQDVSKRFRRATRGKGSYTTFKSSLLSLFRQTPAPKSQYTEAVRDVTLRIPRGASTGVIGRNGSGKSTLLKLITGIYRPGSGQVNVTGRIAALIELGAGFHPDFSGRENLYLGGVMHGLTKRQIDERFDRIVQFAELEAVIDDPVRTYSSGMYMRLGFSLAVHVDPDILLIDEVLAVGDAAFIAKCKDRIEGLRAEGKTLLLVTHDLAAVERWCDEVLWIEQGEVRERGEPRRVIDAYRTFLEIGEEAGLRKAAEEAVVESGVPTEDTRAPQRWGSREVELSSVRLLDSSNRDHLVYHPEDGFTVEYHYRLNEPVKDLVFGIGIHRADGLTVHGSNTEIEQVKLPQPKKEGVVRYRVKRIGLLEGSYTLDVAVHRSDGYPYDYHRNVLQFSIRSPIKQVGVIVPEHAWEVE